MAGLLRAVAVVVCLGVGGVRPVRAGASPTLVVNVIDYAHAPSETLVEAEHHVARVYGVAGITVLWRENLPMSATGDRRQVNVFILSDVMTTQKATTEKIAPGVLGTAAPAPVNRAWIFFDRIEGVADRLRQSAGLVLGHVIAHEVAHIVAHVAHSEDGVMAAVMHPQADAALQGFSAAQSRQIRDAIEAPSSPALLEARDRLRPFRPGDDRSR